tara:strand:- start:2412 stop:2876 length:465 start_codon:yes stop_codon:yes gene_type:complete
MLLVSAFTHSYEYIKFMRWIVFLTFAWSGYIAHHAQRMIPVAMCAAVAIAFNPFIAVGLPRDFWVGLDVFTSVLACAIAWFSRNKEPTAQEKENTRHLAGFVAGLSGIVVGAVVGVYIYKSLGLDEVLGGILAAAMSVIGLYSAMFLVIRLQPK